uniref:Uncharacterized protein n=1 Tax=Drosophila melanogaster TaxID=7227 RepID=Q2MGP3_DROME|nr:uncharacterized protein Dmel_CG33666 [Drosophila melanogaster]AAZ52494.2 uncharacterized protein Dmel_CG33666 [Drosophila melanogaster]|eukprot:NP_001027046.2 uncharacterized protein Dmel_CG33666 [Drosophila melanogaster]
MSFKSSHKLKPNWLSRSKKYKLSDPSMIIRDIRQERALQQKFLSDTRSMTDLMQQLLNGNILHGDVISSHFLEFPKSRCVHFEFCPEIERRRTTKIYNMRRSVQRALEYIVQNSIVRPKIEDDVEESQMEINNGCGAVVIDTIAAAFENSKDVNLTDKRD